MKAFVAPTLNGVDSLVMREIPAPGPLAPGQIRVAMRAASVNFRDLRDLLVLSGQLRSVTLPELIPCSDGAGEVVEVASGVARVKVGAPKRALSRVMSVPTSRRSGWAVVRTSRP